jgi:hypothetical protein
MGSSERQHRYYINNREKELNRTKIWKEANPDKMKSYRKKWNDEKIKCECGSSISRKHISTHKKTKKHLKYIEENN